MTEPQYCWQSVEKRGCPISDIPEEEFGQRLEELIQDLDSLPQVEDVPKPFEKTRNYITTSVIPLVSWLLGILLSLGALL